jgi:hypothetical protein
MSLGLSSPHGFGDALRDLFLLRGADLVQVDTLRHQLFQHLAHEIFIDMLGVKV